MQLPILAIGDLDDRDAETAEDLEVGSSVTSDVGDPSHQEHRYGDTALNEGAGNHEAVTAVIAAAAQHRDLPLEQIAVHGLHGRHDLPAGVLHEHQRRDADLFDRPAVGFAHLSGVQDPHRGRYYLKVRLKPDATVLRVRTPLMYAP